MSKKPVLIILLLAAAVVIVITVLMRNNKTEELSATAQSIKQGGKTIACADALWLLDTYETFISEKFEQIQDSENPTEEELSSMRRRLLDNVTVSQKVLQEWHDNVLLTIHSVYKKNPEAAQLISDSIGADYMHLYQVAMGIKLALINKEEAIAAVKEQFCPEK